MPLLATRHKQALNTVTLMNVNGCDSIVTTITTLAAYDSIGINATTCDPNQVGTNTITLTNSIGCDSLITTVTTLLESDSV